MQPMRMQPMRTQAWTALWAIKAVPDDGFEVIRDGRYVGIARCEDLEDAGREIVRHPLYRSRDRVVCRNGRHQWNVDVDDYDQEPVGA